MIGSEMLIRFYLLFLLLKFDWTIYDLTQKWLILK